MAKFKTKRDNLITLLPEIHDCMKDDNYYEIEIKKFHEKRSLDANAYLWCLITKIANVLRADKDSVYFEMLKRYGQGGVVKIPNNMVSKFERAYKYLEKHEKLFEENAQYYRFWVGSSNYNTKEMSILIEGIISEAKALDIEIESQETIEKLLKNWGKTKGDNNEHK